MKRRLFNNNCYLLIFPFSLIDQYKFWIVVIFFSLFFFVVWDDIKDWWKWELPKKDEDLLKRKSFLWVFIYRIRCYSFQGLWEAYVERLYEAFLLLIIALVLTAFKPLIWAWNFFIVRNKEQIYRKYKEWKQRFRRVISFIYGRLSFLLSFPFYLTHSQIAYNVIDYSYIVCSLIPLYIYIFSVFFILSTIWLLLYKSFNLLVFNFIKVNKLAFPRILISTMPQEIKSTRDFKHKSYKTSSVVIKLRSLVGFNLINLWNPDIQTNRFFIGRKRFSYIRSNKLKSLVHACSLLWKTQHPEMWKHPIISNSVFKSRLGGVVHSHVLSSTKYIFQLLLPKILTSKLSKNTLIAKGIFVNNCKPLLRIPSFNNTQIVESLKPDFFVLNPICEILPSMSTSSYRRVFFKMNRHPNTFFNYSHNNYKTVCDRRYLRTFTLRPQLRLKPRAFMRTNFNISFDDDSIVNFSQNSSFSSFFLRKNKIFLTKKRQKKLIKVRRLTNTFSIRMRFLVLKRNLSILRNRIFSSHSFHQENPFWFPNVSFRRESILLKRIFIFIRKAYRQSQRMSILKNTYLPSKYVQFFHFFLGRRRQLNCLNNLIVFLCHVNSYNYKLLINNKLNVIPLISLRNYPWWYEYSKLIKLKNLKIYADSFDTVFNSTNKHSSYIKSNVRSNYYVNRRIFDRALSMRLRGLNSFSLRTFYRRLFALKRQKKSSSFLRRFLSAKSCRLKYFYDSNFYNRKNALFKLFVINSNLLESTKFSSYKNYESSLRLIICNIIFLFSFIFMCFFNTLIISLIFS